VLERGQEISKKEWKLVRMAIVAMGDSTYIGRVFFGDAEGNVVWDCDCRPSDGCWLALKVLHWTYWACLGFYILEDGRILAVRSRSI
jgi:hypothetical protein